MNTDAQAIVRSLAPSFINETIEHASNCEQAAVEIANRDDLLTRKFLTNIYRKSSLELDFLSKLEYLKRIGHGSEVRGVAVGLQVTEFVRRRLPLDLASSAKNNAFVPSDRRIFSIRFCVRQLQKLVINKFFRFGGLTSHLLGRLNRSFSTESVIRTWVDVSFELYEKEMKDGLVYVYPFGINVRRQFAYIRLLKLKGINFRLDGYDYSMWLFLKWLASRKDIDYANFELSAARRYATLLMRRHPDLKRVYTTDEFEPASFYMHELLQDQNVFVTNKAHGVGKYCPCISYDQFYVFNQAQIDYYSHFSPNTPIKCYESSNPSVHKERPRTVVFIDQLTEPDGSALHKAQLSAIMKLRDISDELSLTFVVKAHPNVKRVDRRYREWASSAPPESFVAPIFFTFYSTAYLTFEKFGRTHLIRDNVFNPALIFGNDARIVYVKKLKDAIQNAIDC